MASYRIHPIVVGSKLFDKSMMTYQHGQGTPFIIPIYVWLLERTDQQSAPGVRKPVILVDTGEMAPIRSADRAEALGGPIHTFEEGLAMHGLKPEDVDVVIHTHLHNDHCENDAKCVGARFYVHEAELERVHNPHPLDYRYLEDYILDIEENGQIEVLRDLPPEGLEIVPGVRVLHTPAHTPGGLSVAVQTAEGLAVITGFCVIRENLEPPREVRAMELEVIPPGTCLNPVEAYEILKGLKTRADILLPLHEPSFATGDPIG